MSNSVTIAQLASSTSPIGYRNRLINGSFDLWQRGTSFTSYSGNPYTADRWKVGYQDDGAYYNQVTSDLAGFNYFMRMTKGGSSYGSHMVQQAIETQNTPDMIGQWVTFSCWARLSNTTTQASHDFNMALGFSVSTDYSGWLNSADICSYYAKWTSAGAQGVTFQAGTTSTNPSTPQQSAGTLTTSWQRFYYTLLVPSNTKTIVTGMYSENTLQNGGIDVVGAQFELGTVPTPFERRHIQQELALAQRYYYRLTGGGAPALFAIGASAASDSNVMWYMQLPVSMRVSPACSSSGANTLGTWPMASGGSTILGSSYYSLGGVSSYPYQHIEVMLVLASSPGTQTHRVGFRAAAGNYIDASAEI
jgi:hypothetical protein